MTLEGNWVLFFAGAGLLLLLLIVWMKQPPKDRENYDVIGALAPNKKAYVRCIQECERQDPSGRLGPGNPRCVHKCELLFGKAAQKSLKVIPPKNNIEICRDKCSHPNKEMEDKCVNVCSCHREVVDYCDRILCPHSTNKDECMKGCVAREIVNCSGMSGWNWKTIR